jgi:hypothetical protein
MFTATKELFTRPSSYQISRSVRLRSNATAYFSKTFAGANNRKTWTWSSWVKRGSLTADMRLFEGYVDASNFTAIILESTNRIQIQHRVGGTSTFNWVTTSVYRDPSAWYHIVVAFDTTQATSTNRIALYVNGVKITAFDTQTTGAQNIDTYVGAANAHNIGRSGAASQYFDGYLAEINCVNGQALTASSFGETNTVTGVWQPKQYTGTYGLNSFELNFSNNSGLTNITIGLDTSGNGNGFTPSNVSITAGVNYDSMLDVPTPFADRGNYPTWNPLTAGALVTFSQGNLNSVSTSSLAPFNIESTIKTPTSGKWYAEVTMTKGASSPAVGIGNNPSASNSNLDQYAAYRVNATYITGSMGASSSGTPATFTTNDVIGIAYDADAGTLVFYKNGTLQTGGFTGVTAGNYSFVVRKDSATGDGGYLNCGQRPFSYTPPSGFLSLNTQNLPDSTIKDGGEYMSALLFTATGSNQTITGAGFAPDFVWIKNRATWAGNRHTLYDTVRGAQARLDSSTTEAEATDNDLFAFDADGFQGNLSGTTYVAWSWNAGGSTVTNTSGSISTQVRANPTAGFSIVTYTGTGANATVGHGLGVAPRMVIVKKRSGSVSNWVVWITGFAGTEYLSLNLTDAKTTGATVWNSTVPTSTVFSIGTANQVNVVSETYVAYCFAAVAGYSAFGSYTGNGSTDGPFVFLGFRPRFVLFKRTDVVNDWVIHDSSRNTYNVVDDFLKPNLLNAEATYATAGHGVDFLSSGMKLRTDSAQINASTGTYIYAAFAENPFKNSLAR